MPQRLNRKASFRVSQRYCPPGDSHLFKIVLLLFLVLLFWPSLAPAPEARAQAAPPAATPGAPTATSPPAPTATPPEATLADQVKETFNALREAQLKRDIILFMSCYSYIYPTLDRKRRDTLAYWENFHFMDLDFSLNDIKPVGREGALARVTWTMQVQNRRSQQFDSFTQNFEVLLARELGKYRIRNIKDISHEED